MNTGFFAQPNPPYRRANYSFAYQWIEEVGSLAALLAHVEALRAADPDHRYLCTLDDIQQGSYTSGHASQDDRLYLDSPPDMDWDDPAQQAAWELQALQHRARQLRQAPQRWAEVCGSLAVSASDIDALLAADAGNSSTNRLAMEEFGSMPKNNAPVTLDGPNLDVILDIPVSISMEVGSTDINIRNLLQLNQGSVIELDRLAGEPLDVLVNGTLIAHGEVVVVNEKFGIRLTDVISPSERIKKLR